MTLADEIQEHQAIRDPEGQHQFAYWLVENVDRIIAALSGEPTKGIYSIQGIAPDGLMYELEILLAGITPDGIKISVALPASPAGYVSAPVPYWVVEQQGKEDYELSPAEAKNPASPTAEQIIRELIECKVEGERIERLRMNADYFDPEPVEALEVYGPRQQAAWAAARAWLEGRK